MNTSGLKLHPQGVLVIWEWEWDGSSGDKSDGHEAVEKDQNTNEYLMSDQEDGNEDTESVAPLPLHYHAVTFKCIGSVNDSHAQEILKRVSAILKQAKEVPVKIEPEPHNQYDSKAIVFKCKLDDEWHSIGYVVRECLDHVHKALEDGTVISVTFSWAKYIVCWSRSGPGYYGGITIKVKGDWPQDVVRHASTR